MLNIYYGNMKESVYNTAAYFKYDYEDSWIVDPFVKEMIQDVDQSKAKMNHKMEALMLKKIWMRTKSIILMQYHLQMNQDIRMVSIASDLWRRNLQIKKQEIS